MDFNEIVSGKCVPLGILSIVIFYLIGGASSSVLPFIFLTCIAVGYIKSISLTDTIVAGLLVSFIGGIINLLISVGLVYVSYGATYAMYMFTSVSSINLILSIIVGIIGGAIGYFIKDEVIKNNNNQIRE
ncbi:DUF5518 domain-containing protein [Methanosphaera cuniculi]|nr:DUF5518 domain-containing protein [Methanosphaera cuniculi]PWL07621.1 hypothetical protein MSCUN_14950 [Methanosphaera cuniculi]